MDENEVQRISSISQVISALLDGKTPKPILISTLEDIYSFGVKNLSFIVNDLRSKGSSAYSYRYKYASKKN